MECNFENCGYYTDGECNICGMGISGEDTFCRLCKDNPKCYYKQLAELKAENECLKEEFEIESLTDKTTGETIYRSNSVNKLKELLKVRIENLCESCGASSMMPMPCTVYKQTLQEINNILLQAMDVKSNAYNHFLKVEQAIDLITKAEEE